MSNELVVRDKFELMALHRALMEAKFHGEPNDPAVAGSALVASVANRIVDLLQDLEPDWREWRAVDETRREWTVALARAKEVDVWSSWTRREKVDYAQILLSPFVVTDALIDRFIQLVDGG